MSDDEKYHAWQKRLAKRLPDLAARTFGLRGKAYPGYGMHYALERQLGSVIRIASTYDFTSIGERIVNKVIVEGFHADLSAAERSAHP